MTDFEIYLKTYKLIILLGNMPSKPINYTNTCFYKILCRDTNISVCYVGHTTDFTKRKSRHKSKCNDQKDKHFYIYLYQFIPENGGWDNWDMINIETRSCRGSLEAKSIEREFVEKQNATLNIRRPFRTSEEIVESRKLWRDNNLEYNKPYSQDNEEEHNAYSKQYREVHKEEIKEWKKKHYQENKEDILAKQKEDYENHKEVKLERNRLYRENNKEKIKAQACQVINCECGNTYTRQNKNRHLNSQKHQAYLKQQEEN